jgi:hypothetical protein
VLARRCGDAELLLVCSGALVGHCLLIVHGGPTGLFAAVLRAPSIFQSGLKSVVHCQRPSFPQRCRRSQNGSCLSEDLPRAHRGRVVRCPVGSVRCWGAVVIAGGACAWRALVSLSGKRSCAGPRRQGSPPRPSLRRRPRWRLRTRMLVASISLYDPGCVHSEKGRSRAHKQGKNPCHRNARQ